MGTAACSCAKCLHIDRNDISGRVVSKVFTCLHNCVQIHFVTYCKIWVNKVVVWLWSWGHAQIHGGGCGIVWPTGRVWWAKHVPLWAIIGIFLQIPTKCAGDMLRLVHITKILHRCDITLFYNVMMSLMMVITHPCVAGHVIFWYERGHTWWGVVLLPETFKRLDCSKHACSDASDASL